ncbi:hypothetical protein IGS68_29285 (plasmid) [Skermanella sp. TT6]|uniref:Uncharacterized protein n=1 Tax=Skermanella cutis TaxID=2775420 RepID=A0ABX7BHG4_9PROT|nr:hypothetical protein [Skermanella sp. TT6]QQP93216.1 hypothetical protein IGS68_29285 [Skermanella sp. TT6]
MAEDEIAARFDDLQTSLDALTRGLGAMNETLETHTEMLAALLEAATVEPEKDSPLQKTLEKIFLTLKTQTDVLVQVGGMLDRMGPTVEMAVIRGVHRAVGTVDEDGVIQE